jgi:alpha-tubulin suppressor-like RCC1 family protein
VRCWGNNQFGQLGIGNTQNIGDNPGEMPPQDVSLYTKPK